MDNEEIVNDEFINIMARFLARLGDEDAGANNNANSLHLPGAQIVAHTQALRAHLFDGAALPDNFPGASSNIVEEFVAFVNAHPDRNHDFKFMFDNLAEMIQVGGRRRKSRRVRRSKKRSTRRRLRC